jgi:hypothetical protein
MASEQTSQQDRATQRKEPRDSRVRPEPPVNSGPALLNDGLELVRDSHC